MHADVMLAWWSVQQHSLGRLDAHPQEQLGVHEGQLDGLPQLTDLLLEAADLRVVHLSGVLGEHVEHHGVHLGKG